jgi:HEAT repeat protein
VALLAAGPNRQRIAAARALGSLRAVEANDALLELLADPDHQVRGAAVKALQQIAGGWE